MGEYELLLLIYVLSSAVNIHHVLIDRLQVDFLARRFQLGHDLSDREAPDFLSFSHGSPGFSLTKSVDDVYLPASFSSHYRSPVFNLHYTFVRLK